LADKCKCGADLAFSAKSGKYFCSALCWLPPEKRNKKPPAPQPSASDDRYNPYETKIDIQAFWDMHSHREKRWTTACIQASNSYVSDRQFAGAQGDRLEIESWKPSDIKAMHDRACAFYSGVVDKPPFLSSVSAEKDPAPGGYEELDSAHSKADSLPF